MSDFITIKDRKIGKGCPVFIAAEVSSNHLQKFDNAIKLIREAKRSGADAIKFQAYTPDSMTIDVNNKYVMLKHPKWGNQTLYQLYKKAYTPPNWFKRLKRVADDIGIIFFATAFDKEAVDMLEDLDVPAHKVSSFELVDLELIRYMAKTKKPIIISTGMATIAEIREAVKTAKAAEAKSIMLLKCISSYPAKPEEANLRTIPHMREVFKCPVGLSDHTIDNCIALASVPLGACAIEKHFTLSRSLKTEDGFFSIEPRELSVMVKEIRMTEKALGNVRYGPTHEETKTRVHRRSLFAVEDIAKGDMFTKKNIRSIRPGYGLAPKYLSLVLGKKAAKNIKRGTPIRKSVIAS